MLKKPKLNLILTLLVALKKNNNLMLNSKLNRTRHIVFINIYTYLNNIQNSGVINNNSVEFYFNFFKSFYFLKKQAFNFSFISEIESVRFHKIKTPKYFNNIFSYNLKNFIKETKHIYFYKYSAITSTSKTCFYKFLITRKLLKKKKKIIYNRPFLLSSQLSHFFKKLKKFKLKKKKKSALIFFKKFKAFSFIKLRRRSAKPYFIKYFKKWKFKSKSRFYRLFSEKISNSFRSDHDSIGSISTQKFKMLIVKNNGNSLVFKNKFINNSNLTPFNRFDTRQQKFFLKNIIMLKNKFFPKFFINFSSNFLEKISNKKLWFRIYSNPSVSKFEKSWISYFSKKFFFFQRQFKSVLHLNEFIYVLLLTLKNKDIFFLKNWLINFLEKINLKKHKSFIRNFKRLVLALLTTSSKIFKVNGFFFDIRGKVGVAGNAKKRHLSIKYKNFGFSKIKSKADQIKFIVRTNTGVLGCTLIITY